MTPSAALWIVSGSWLLSGIAALWIRDPVRSRIAGFGGGAVASFLGLVFPLGGFFPRGPVRIPVPAPVPRVASELFIDGLSAFFLGIVFLLGFLASLYAIGYMREYDGGDVGGPRRCFSTSSCCRWRWSSRPGTCSPSSWPEGCSTC